jgi:twitching motility protein PilT
MEEKKNEFPEIDVLLEELVLREASDLHIRVGEPPIYRIFGQLTRSELPVISDESAKKLLYNLMGEEYQRKFEEHLELDFAYGIPGVARFRVNVFKQKGHLGAAMRVIPLRIKTIDEWGLPQILKKLSLLPYGLVIITGPTGSGKSTTLAAMIEHINQNKSAHIITVEDPIEFVFKDNLSTIEQRELGIDTKSFTSSLRYAVRQSPDILMIGEMRDYETISLAIKAAEMGHLVLGTLHTADAAQTIDRVINIFPQKEQDGIRLELSNTLYAVIAQALIPSIDGTGFNSAFEVLTCTQAVRSLIKEGKTPQIYSAIQSGAKYGMQSLDSQLKKLYQDGLISFESALSKCTNPDEFEHSLIK